MKTNLIKLMTIAGFVLTIMVLTSLRTETTRVLARDDAPETVYKAKCAMCHSPKAEKSYDPAMPEEEQVKAILDGKKGEKPPNMPAYREKGITEEQAKALVAYMKGLRTPPAE